MEYGRAERDACALEKQNLRGGEKALGYLWSMECGGGTRDTCALEGGIYVRAKKLTVYNVKLIIN